MEFLDLISKYKVPHAVEAAQRGGGTYRRAER